tara:strand:- start:531 stop:1301 length:771 start_codon:yes stop_codon:yes gene_type:complete
MTNFSNNYKSNSLLSPERAVLIFPILISLIICAFGSFALLRPLLKRSNRIKGEFIAYQIKKENLLIQRKKLELLNDRFEKVNSQKQFIIKIIGGTNDIGTLIAKINKLTNNNKVIVTGLEPKSINKYQTPINTNFDNNQINNSIPGQSLPPESTIPLSNNVDNNLSLVGNKTPSKDIDPLLIPELEQHIISLSLEGSFQEILFFIRNLELLENIVLTSNIKFERINDSQDNSKNNSIKSNKVNTKFSTILSAYGRI